MSFILQPSSTTVGAYTATASGTITKGSPVSVNTDGTLSQSGPVNTTPVNFTTSAIISSSYASAGTNAIAFDPTSGTILASFRQVTTGYLMVVAGKLAGTTVSWGAPVVVSSSATADVTASIIWDSTNSKFVVVSFYSGANAFAAVCTVTGTSVSVGSVVDVVAGVQTAISACYDSANSKIIVAYNTSADTSYAVVGTVSGTSISFGTAVRVPTTIILCTSLSCSFNPSVNKTVIVYLTASGIKSVPATTSGTSISIGTASPYQAITSGTLYSVYDPTSQNVAVFVTGGKGFVAKVTGTTASNGSIYTGSFNTPIWAAYDSTNSKINIIYSSFPSSSDISIQTATVSALVITYQTAIIAGNNGVFPVSICGVWDPTNGKLVIVWSSTSNTYYLVGYGSNYANFLGFASSSVTDGNSIMITTIGGRDLNQSALTTASKYYVKSDGTLSTTSDAITVYAGTALSATSILVKGQP